MSAKRQKPERPAQTQGAKGRSDGDGIRGTPVKFSAAQAREASPSPRSVKRPGDELTTPTSKRTLPFHAGKQDVNTPVKPITPSTHAADKSARRKTTRRLLEQALTAEGSDEGNELDDQLAQEIVGEEVAGHVNSDEDEAQDELDAEDSHLETSATALGTEVPVKRGRGRPKGSKNREPTPPTDLPAHEWYFWINRPAGNKTSANDLATAALLNHSTYHDTVKTYDNSHADNIQNLHDHHASQFPLWDFELAQGFNVLLYGYGNKAPLLKAWADWLHAKHDLQTRGPSHQDLSKGQRRSKKAAEEVNLSQRSPITIFLDAHHEALTPRAIFSTISQATLAEDVARSIPNQLTDACSYLIERLPQSATDQLPIFLLINPIHASVLSHAPMPSLLAQLSQHSRIHILATADDPHFPLLWPQGLRDQFNWIFHDGTTFVPYDSEGKGQIAGSGVVDTVNELLGRKGARGKGREGVRWVLRSLPENARGVYRILVTEILSADADEGLGQELDIDDVIHDDEDEEMIGAGGNGFGTEGGRIDGQRTSRQHELPIVSYKTLYTKAVEEFLCSSEMAFRGLLKEFVDHQMVIIKRDMAGQEALGIEMRRDELEGVLEDLTLAD